MRLLVAFDKFKDALSAAEACGLAAREFARWLPLAEIDACPLSDGGDGFASTLTTAAGGKWVEVEVKGPRGDPVRAGYGCLPLRDVPPQARACLDFDAGDSGMLGIVEMAAASGLAQLDPSQRDPWLTTSWGTGQLLQAAAGHGVSGLLLGIGGSSTNDLGLGALGALGWRFVGADGGEISPPVPRHWERIQRIEGAKAAHFPPLCIACDVSNPLLGARGAAAVYGPQKGLQADDLEAMEQAMARLAAMLCAHTGSDPQLMTARGAGAAGGMAFGLVAAFGARLVAGSELVAGWLDLDRRIREADLVISGEGFFDDSSLAGKGPGAVIQKACALGRPAHVFAGQVNVSEALGHCAWVHAITPAGMPLFAALPKTREHLVLSVRQLAQKLAGQ